MALSCQISLYSQRSPVSIDTVRINRWYAVQCQILDSTLDFHLLTACEGEGYSVLLLPKKKKQIARLFNNDPNEILLSSLINKKDSNLGFVYKQLSHIVRVKKISEEESWRQHNQIQFEKTEHKLVRIKWTPIIFFGNYKRAFMENVPKISPGRHLNTISILNEKTGEFLNADIFGKEFFVDTAKKRNIIFFLPEKLNDLSSYQIVYKYQTHGAGVSIHLDAQLFSLDQLQNDGFDTIFVSSTPRPCIVYKIPQQEYDTEEQVWQTFSDLKKNNYRLTPRASNFLNNSRYIVPEGPTDVTIPTKKINYIFFIRKGDQLSPPLECQPDPRKLDRVNWNFDIK